MSKRRPYVYEDREWPEIAGIEEKIDVQSDEVPQSEFDQPYLFGDDEDDTYQSYETDYPELPRYPFPDPDPVPIPGPCNAEDGCGFVTITNVPEEVECDTTHHFLSIHEVHGCEPASFEDAFLTWWIAEGPGEILAPDEGGSVLGAVYKAPIAGDGDTVVICVSSIAGDCSDCRSFKISCPVCCSDEMEIVGADTANPGTIWAGAIDPPCPGATCSVSNNSGCPMTCSVNSDGTTVTVGVGAKNCGSFTVTVEEDTTLPGKEDCPGESASKTVRINGNGGRWVPCWDVDWFLCNGPFCSCTYTEGERRWSIKIGAGIFCGACDTATCYDNWESRPPLGNALWSIYLCASTCDTNGPCAGRSLYGTALSYWANPDCECI